MLHRTRCFGLGARCDVVQRGRLRGGGDDAVGGRAELRGAEPDARDARRGPGE